MLQLSQNMDPFVASTYRPNQTRLNQWHFSLQPNFVDVLVFRGMPNRGVASLQTDRPWPTILSHSGPRNHE